MLRTLVLFLVLPLRANGFVPATRWNPVTEPQHRTGPIVSMAFSGLAKKMKEKEIAPLKSEAENPDSALAHAIKARGTKTPSGAVVAALKKPPGCISCVAEYRRKGVPAVIDEMLPPAIISPVFRSAGAHAVSILLDGPTGGCSAEDVAGFVKEQKLAQGDFPGPLPVIVHDTIIDEVQVAQAAALGAAGVVLGADILGEALGSMVKAVQEYGMEPIVKCRSVLELEAVGELGVELIAIAGVPVDEALNLLPSFPKDTTKIAFLPCYNDKQLIEAEEAWRMRDAGFNVMWASEVLWKLGLDSAESDNAHSIIRAITSKGSVKYARASGAFLGKGEGAKEFLGTIEM